MKRILTIIAATLCIIGCNKERTNFWSRASYATIEAVTGHYSLISAQWDSPIDLSGNGLVTNDILHQLQTYGWTGIQTIKYLYEEEYTCILHRSLVITPTHPEEHTQINLYVPYPEYGTECTIHKENRCNIDIQPYQFHYNINSRGELTLFGVDDRKMSGEGGTLTNVSILFEGNSIYFEADTSFYDWATSSWQDGRLSLEYQHN